MDFGLEFEFDELIKAQCEEKSLKARIVKLYDNRALVSMGGHLAKLSQTPVDQFGKLRVGDEIDVIILHINEESKKVYVSGDPARQIGIDEWLAKFKNGDRHSGVVVSIAEYGIFVSVNGRSGLLPNQEMGWSSSPQRVNHFKVGQSIDVVVKSINQTRKRLQWTRKPLIPHPFDEFAQKILDQNSLDRAHFGIVENVVDYGIFVNVDGSGCDGLLHVTSLPAALTLRNRKVNPDLHKVLRNASNLPVRILNIDKERRRLSLEYAGKNIEKSEVDSWPFPGEIYDGRLISVDDTKAQISLPSSTKGYLYAIDDKVGFSKLAFACALGDALSVRVLSVDFSVLAPRLELVDDNRGKDDDNFTFVLENFLSGNSYLDLERKINAKNPYLILAEHLDYFKGARLNKTFDYIYHFGHVFDVDDIKLFGLLHRASIEFRLNQPELALALIASALRDAIRLRRKRMVVLATAIIKKQQNIIYQ